MKNRICLSLLSVAVLASCGEIKAPGSGGDAGGNPEAAPTITSISPARGAIGGGTEVTITGSDFAADVIVIVGDVVVSDVAFVDESELTITTPAGFAADVPLSILVYGDNGFGELPEAFTYNAAPVAESASPAFGPLAGGTIVEIRGKFFQEEVDGAITVTFGGVASPNVDVIDDSTIRATTPAGVGADVALPQEIIVSSANGEAKIEEAFAYVRPGLLFTKKSGNELDFGLYFFDIETRRILKLAELNDAFGRILVDPNNRVLLRHNRNFGSRTSPNVWAEFDAETSSFTDLATPSSTLAGVVNQGGTLFGANNGLQFGSVSLPDMSFTRIGTTNIPERSLCLAPGPSNTVMLLTRDTSPIRSINIATGVISAGATLSGDLPTGDPNFGCHGAASVGTTIFALFTGAQTGTSLREASIYAINRVTGVANKLADLPPGSSGLEPTPLTGF